MDKFDEKVIGYESAKNILRQILDALKRPELYKSKGASIPRGLLMESDPGLGKSLLATVFIKESGRKSLVFRKTSQENSFLDELRAAFSAAKEAAPSILLLEDLNLYVESNSPYAPEWACLQACIDDAKSTDLFVIATTNDTKYMPPSLLRPGRFDYTLYLDPPMGKIAERIVSYYLRDKDLAEDVLISDIVKAMPKVSCATLETVMNLAALNSTYQGHEHIYKDDVTDALLQVVYKLSKTDKSLDLTECQKIALHEAAHAVVGEILNPDSIGIVTIRGNQSCVGGFENGCSTYLKSEEELLNDITKTLAGKAGVSLIYGMMDVNASGDIQNANRLLDLWMTSLAGAGFSEVESANNRMSETRLFSSEAIKAAKGRASEDTLPVVHIIFCLADAKLFHQPSTVLLIFRSPLCIFNTVLIEQLLHQQSQRIFPFGFSLCNATVFHFIKHIAHIVWAPFLAIGICIVRFLKPIIIRHNTQQLKRFLHMGQILRTRNVVAVFPLLHEVVCNNLKIALEKLYLLMGQICNLEQVDFIVVDIRLKFFGNVQPLFQGKRPIPRFIVAEVKHQRYNRIEIFAVVEQLRPVLCAIVTHDTERHIGVRCSLVLKTDTGYTDISVLPAFGNISLDLTNPAICLVVGAWSLIFQFIRRQNLLAVEQKHVHNVRKDIVIGFQNFFRCILLRHPITFFSLVIIVAYRCEIYKQYNDLITKRRVRRLSQIVFIFFLPCSVF